MRIAIVNSKGGVGKTTTAVYLATAAARDGQEIELWDADIQGSATEWASRAHDEGEPLEYEVHSVSLPTLRRKQVVADWVIVDTPPGQAEVMQAAVDFADFVIVPVMPEPMGLDRAYATLDGIAHGKDAALLLGGVDSREKLTLTTREVLMDESAPPKFSTEIRRRTAISQNTYSRPHKLYGYETVYKELKELAGE